jgi:hypothetical protein
MVTTAAAVRPAAVGVANPDVGGDAGWGWYFYGVTRRAPLAPVLAAADRDEQQSDDHTRASAAPLQLLECSGLAGVVRSVLLSDFTQPALGERLQRASALEASVRSHHHVIETIHARQAILPAKFALVYARAEDVVSALRSAHDKFLDELRRLEECDEWAVHLYADRAVYRQRISTVDAAIRLLRADCAAARPGRAYFIERQICDELEAATELALLTRARSAFDRLASYAVAREMSSVAPAADPRGEREILRASFLVSRDAVEHFIEEVRSSGDSTDGVRCDYSGPWPPYSFTTLDYKEAR